LTKKRLKIERRKSWYYRAEETTPHVENQYPSEKKASLPRAVPKYDFE